MEKHINILMEIFYRKYEIHIEKSELTYSKSKNNRKC